MITCIPKSFFTFCPWAYHFSFLAPILKSHIRNFHLAKCSKLNLTTFYITNFCTAYIFCFRCQVRQHCAEVRTIHFYIRRRNSSPFCVVSLSILKSASLAFHTNSIKPCHPYSRICSLSHILVEIIDSYTPSFIYKIAEFHFYKSFDIVFVEVPSVLLTYNTFHYPGFFTALRSQFQFLKFGSR